MQKNVVNPVVVPTPAILTVVKLRQGDPCQSMFSQPDPHSHTLSKYVLLGSPTEVEQVNVLDCVAISEEKRVMLPSRFENNPSPSTHKAPFPGKAGGIKLFCQLCVLFSL